LTDQINNSEIGEVEIHKSEWQASLEDSAKNVHLIGTWIAIVFDPIFVITDYLNLREHYLDLLIVEIEAE
jgi:hypothetical protein